MKKYATAIGILVGGAIGGVLGIPLRVPYLIGVFSLVGLVIGYVISVSASSYPTPVDPADAEGRLKRLEELRAKALITEKEYEAKRQEILRQL